MAVFSMTSPTILVGAAITGTAPGAPGTQTVAGTITSTTDISIMVTSIDIGLSAESLEYTNFASGGWRLNTVGLKSGTVQVNFNQDFAAAQVDVLFGLGGTFGFGTGTVFYMDVKPTSAARGATNPSYLLALLNTEYKPAAGSVGDLAVVSMSFTMTGLPGRLTS